jgi:addiction module HigA family antidote
MRMLNPPHPGDFIRTEIIEAHGLTVTNAAEILGVSRPTLSTLLNAKGDLSGDMALRVEKAFGVKMDTLMRMQNSYDIARTRRREGKIRVRRYKAARTESSPAKLRRPCLNPLIRARSCFGPDESRPACIRNRSL